MKRSATDEASGGLLEFLETDPTAAVLRGLPDARPELRREADGLARSHLRESDALGAAMGIRDGRRSFAKGHARGRGKGPLLESPDRFGTNSVGLTRGAREWNGT